MRFWGRYSFNIVNSVHVSVCLKILPLNVIDAILMWIVAYFILPILTTAWTIPNFNNIKLTSRGTMTKRVVGFACGFYGSHEKSTSLANQMVLLLWSKKHYLNFGLHRLIYIPQSTTLCLRYNDTSSVFIWNMRKRRLFIWQIYSLNGLTQNSTSREVQLGRCSFMPPYF